ncbi:MAG: serine/threonine-protein kinase [Nocardioidaceae bacterium]
MTTPAASSTRTVGPYRLRAQVGEGGMGVVYVAEGPQGGRVAVKVLRPHVVGDANGRARLAREVTSLRRVRSPRIAEVYDADPWGETPYVVTRYVPGPSLREVVDSRGPLQRADLLRLARGLAEALVVVHGADVLHRDVKPSNVLLQDGDPVLIDFGLAQLSDDMTLTQTGWLLGTPGYLAPEILYGDAPSPAADVHAWAATVVYAATGSGPYGSGPPMAVMDRARRGEFDLTGVPGELVPVLTAALRLDPANRPTARQVVEWLGATGPGGAGATRSLPGPPAARGPAAEPGRLRRAACWLCVVSVLVAGTVAAPVATFAVAVALGWALRTLALAGATARSRQASRGPRRRDPAMTVLALPWFAVRRMVASLVNAICVLVGAGGFVVLARFGPSGVERSALLGAGLAAALLSWWGPLTRDVRRGADLVAARLPRSGLALTVVLVLLLAIACGFAAAQQVAGTTYAPFSGR